MRSIRVSVIVAVGLTPVTLQADATIRYKTDISSPMPQVAALSPSSSVIYMKGNKGASIAGGNITIVDFTTKEITIVDTEGKKYSTIPASEYGAKIAAAMPQTGAASDMLKSMKTRCDSKKSGRVEVIQGVQAEEREITCSIEMSLPQELQKQAGGGMAGMGMKFVMQIWNASAGEKPRVPALWQLSGFELWQKYFMNPVEMIRKATPGMAPMMDEMAQDQSPMLRSSMTMYMDMHMPGVAASNAPLMKMTLEVVELSTAPLDDALFRIPADCTAAAFGEVMNGIAQGRMQTLKVSENQARLHPIPGNVQAYVSWLKPVSSTQPVTAGEAGVNDVHGIVTLLVTIGPKGTVEQAEALSGPEALHKTAIDTVKSWTFRPVLRSGAAVSAYTNVNVDFNDYSKGIVAPFEITPDLATAQERRTQLQEAMPRTARQILADLEQDAGGDSRSRRSEALPALAAAALDAGADEQAKTYANEMLAGASQDKAGWNYGNAIHDGHMVLGRVALRSNDIAGADRELLEAGKTPGSPQLNSFGPNMTLASELLQKGERDTVLQYFALCRNFWKMGTGRLDDWSESVRKGESPTFGTSLR